jgi:hypothetical protein
MLPAASCVLLACSEYFPSWLQHLKAALLRVCCVLAGLIALSCATLKATLGLRITTHEQLACVVTVVHQVCHRKATEPSAVMSAADVEQFIWINLRDWFGSSGSSSRTPVWQLETSHAQIAFVFLLTAVVEGLDPSALPKEFQTYTMEKLVQLGSRGLQSFNHAAQSSSSSTSGSSSSSQQHGARPGSTDDCALLRQHYSNLGPVLRATADWVAAGGSSADAASLLTAVKQYMNDDINAACTDIYDKVMSDGPERRTLLPLYVPRIELEPGVLAEMVAASLQAMVQDGQLLPPDVCKAVARLVADAAGQLVDQWRLDRYTQAGNALMQAAFTAGGCHTHICHVLPWQQYSSLVAVHMCKLDCAASFVHHMGLRGMVCCMNLQGLQCRRTIWCVVLQFIVLYLHCLHSSQLTHAW